MNTTNGHDIADTEAAIAAMKQLVTTSMPIHERIANADLPFSQKTHTLLLESVDQLAQQWINEMATVRSNTLEVENLLLAQLAKVKDHLTRLHLLGAMAAKEAERGRDVGERLAAELDQMLAAPQ